MRSRGSFVVFSFPVCGIRFFIVFLLFPLNGLLRQLHRRCAPLGTRRRVGRLSVGTYFASVRNLGHAQAPALLLAGVSIVLYVAGSVMHRVFFVVFEIWFGKHELCVPNRVPEALWPFFILSFGTRGGLGPPTGE